MYEIGHRDCAVHDGCLDRRRYIRARQRGDERVDDYENYHIRKARTVMYTRAQKDIPQTELNSE